MDIYKTGEVFFGEFPLMTDRGTFVINGSEKLLFHNLLDHQEVTLKMKSTVKMVRWFTLQILFLQEGLD
nr:hypothetical protein [Spiroplasma clarkii]